MENLAAGRRMVGAATRQLRSISRVDYTTDGRKEHLNIETLENGDTLIGFHRKIQSVGERYITEHYHAYGGTEPPPIDHEGINDANVEKASTVHYWHTGEWLKLTGAD